MQDSRFYSSYFQRHGSAVCSHEIDESPKPIWLYSLTVLLKMTPYFFPRGSLWLWAFIIFEFSLPFLPVKKIRIKYSIQMWRKHYYNSKLYQLVQRWKIIKDNLRVVNFMLKMLIIYLPNFNYSSCKNKAINCDMVSQWKIYYYST